MEQMTAIHQMPSSEQLRGGLIFLPYHLKMAIYPCYFGGNYPIVILDHIY